jgi:hypothetical protein
LPGTVAIGLETKKENTMNEQTPSQPMTPEERKAREEAFEQRMIQVRENHRAIEKIYDARMPQLATRSADLVDALVGHRQIEGVFDPELSLREHIAEIAAWQSLLSKWNDAIPSFASEKLKTYVDRMQHWRDRIAAILRGEQPGEQDDHDPAEEWKRQ